MSAKRSTELATGPSIVTPDPSRQVRFYQLLLAARQTWLMDALSATLRALDANVIKEELAAVVPRDVQAILAGAGIRDEHIFPTPTILKTRPCLLGYYRLLLGVPRKTFYGSGGRGLFSSMEERDVLGRRQAELLPPLIVAMTEGLAGFVRQTADTLAPRDVQELPILTLGSYFQGLNNNQIGAAATQQIFLAFREIVKWHIESETETSITIRNAAGRAVEIVRASDPDIGIREHFGREERATVAIEIKGGTDVSNAHNRAGEAEKSHRKAFAAGFRDFWTIIATEGLRLETLKAESPTTLSWFDAPQVLARAGDDWEAFRSRLAGACGIPDAPPRRQPRRSRAGR